VRPLVVWHTERVDNPNRFIVGLLRYRPAVTVHDLVAYPGDRESRRTPPARTWFGVRRATELIVHVGFLMREAAQRLGLDGTHIDVISAAASRRLA